MIKMIKAKKIVKIFMAVAVIFIGVWINSDVIALTKPVKDIQINPYSESGVDNPSIYQQFKE